MKKIVFCMSAMLVGLPAFGAAMAPKPADIKLGETGIKVTPLLTTKLTFDNNLFGTGTENPTSKKDVPIVDATILEINPSAKFFMETGKDKYTATISVPSKLYLATGDTDLESGDDTAAATAVDLAKQNKVRSAGMDETDHTDWNISGDFHKEFNSRNRLDLIIGFGHTTEDRSSAASVDTLKLNAFNKLSWKATYGFGVEDARFHSDAYFKQDVKQYDKVLKKGDKKKSEKNSTANSFGLIGYVKVAPKTDALLEVRSTILDYTETVPAKKSNFDLTTYLVGVKWGASEKIKFTGKIGAQSVNSEEFCVLNAGTTTCSSVTKGGDTINKEAWEVTGTYKPQTYSSITLETNKVFGLESQGEEFATTSSTIVGWKHELNDRLTSNLKYTNAIEHLVNGDGLDTLDHATNSLEAKLSYVFQRWCKFDVGYNTTAKDYTEFKKNGAVIKKAGPTDKFNKNVIFFAAEMSL